VRRIFKDLTGIRVSRKKFAKPIALPEPLEHGDDPRLDDSGMELMTPDFTQDVGHCTNSTILSKTADLAVQEINVSNMHTHGSIILLNVLADLNDRIIHRKLFWRCTVRSLSSALCSMSLPKQRSEAM
jgi:hypothetical protein